MKCTLLFEGTLEEIQEVIDKVGTPTPTHITEAAPVTEARAAPVPPWTPPRRGGKLRQNKTADGRLLRDILLRNLPHNRPFLRRISVLEGFRESSVNSALSRMYWDRLVEFDGDLVILTKEGEQAKKGE